MATPNASPQAPRQTALVTGATGFIGGHLVRHLASLGWKVHALARQVSTDADIALAASWHSYNGDYQSVSRAVASSKPDVVFHLASLFLSEHKPDHIDALVDANLRFGMHLLEAMHQHNVRRLINTGTSWQHYNNADYDPVNLYAATKQSFEAIIEYYCNAYNLSVVTLKIYDTYGHNDLRSKLIPTLQKVQKSGDIFSMKNGDKTVFLVEVSDIARAYMVAADLTRQRPGHMAYGTPGEYPIQIKDVVRRLEQMNGKPIKINWVEEPTVTRSPKSPAKLVCLKGWRASRSFPEGLD